MRHALLLALASTAHAQAGGEVPRDRGEPDGPASHSRANEAIAGDLAVGLARVCVAECGWHVALTGECAAIYQVVQDRARRRGVTELRALRDYASGHFDAARSRRPWIAGLVSSGRRPRHWPPRLRWSVHRPVWLEAIEHARAVIAGLVASPCVEAPAHWGQPFGGDLARARRAGWRRLDCGSAVNAYWGLR